MRVRNHSNSVESGKGTATQGVQPVVCTYVHLHGCCPLCADACPENIVVPALSIPLWFAGQ